MLAFLIGFALRPLGRLPPIGPVRPAALRLESGDTLLLEDGGLLLLE